MFFNRQSAFLWVLAVFRFVSTCSFFSYETYFIQGLLNKNEKKQVRCIKFTFRFIDDVLTLNSYKFDDLVDRIYPIELEIKDTTDTSRSDSHLDPHPEIDSQVRLKMNLYDKRVISMIHCELSIYI